MEPYAIALICIASIVVFLLTLFVVGGYFFFKGIFKRKPFSLLGDKPNETGQRVFVKEERRKAIEHLDTLPNEKQEVVTFDGLTLRGELFKAPNGNPDGKLLICVHGYTSHGRREFAAYVPHVHDLGVDVLLVDDRAHGDSDGKYTGFSVLDRIDVKYWVEKMKPNYKKIYLFGISMGAATSAMVAADMPEIAGLLFDCGFTSPIEAFRATGTRHAPRFVVDPVFFFGRIWCKILLGFDFMKVSALEEIKKVKCPCVFVQGTADVIVPPHMSNQMYEACGSERKRQELFEGAEHVASYYLEKDRYVEILKDFFAK